MTGFNFEVVDAAHYDELRRVRAGGGRLGRRARRHRTQFEGRRPGGGDRPPLGSIPATRRRSDRRGACDEHAGGAGGTVPSVHAIVATAESTPFDDGATDLVVVGNAFHHFDRDAAMAEIQRILRPGGTLALFWAWPADDEQLEHPGMRAIYEAVDGTHAEAAIMAAHRSWAGRPRPPGSIRSSDGSLPRPTSCRRRDSPISTRPSATSSHV